ncbi:MAG: DJ-1/PfpI family protein [Candidatus Hodarchaeota archaeon]
MKKGRYVVRILVIVSILLYAFTGINGGVLVDAIPMEEVDILLLMDHDWGANYPFIREIFEEYRWNITITGLYESLVPCDYNPMDTNVTVDLHVSEISDITVYDCLCIMPGSSHRNLLNSSEALDLVRTAVTEGLIVAAWCRAVRVLARADVINGKNVTGHADYKSEYEAAGATFFEGVPPIIDGNIVTGVRSRYYRQEMCEAIATALGCYESNSPSVSNVNIDPLRGVSNTEFKVTAEITDASPLISANAHIFPLSESNERTTDIPLASIELKDSDKDAIYNGSKILNLQVKKYTVDIVVIDVFYNNVTSSDVATIEIIETPTSTPGWTAPIFISATILLILRELKKKQKSRKE